MQFRARSKTGGRGLTGDRVVLDEAFALDAAHMGSLLPTLGAVPNPQVLYASSAGLRQSEILRGIRNRGRPGGDASLVYVEWCAPEGGCRQATCTHAVGVDGCALDDRDCWYVANPAVARGRKSLEKIATFRRALPPEEFAREEMGWWDDPPDDIQGFLTAWLDCLDPKSTATGRPVFAVDAAPGSRSAAIVAATRRPDGLPHVEVVEHLPGVDWVPGRCEALKGNDPLGWVLDPAGPVGALLPDLADVGIEPRQMTARELGQACEDVAAKATAGAVRHVGDPILTGAIAGAGRRDIGDGLWAWSRRKSGTDICPLVAATEALWLLSTTTDETYDVLKSVW